MMPEALASAAVVENRTNGDDGNSTVAEQAPNLNNVVIKEEIDDEPAPHVDLASYLVQVCIKEEDAGETAQTPEDGNHPIVGQLNTPITDSVYFGNFTTSPTDASWKCEVCDSPFKRRHNLVEHRKTIHQLESPILDEIHYYQGAYFHQQAAEREERLRVHQQQQITSSQPCSIWPCPECGRLFDSADGLRRHLATHQEPEWKCEVCGHRFIRKSDLRRHRGTRHSLSDEPTEANRVEAVKAVPLASEDSAPSPNIEKINDDGQVSLYRPWGCEVCPSMFTRKSGLTAHRLRYHKLNSLVTEEINWIGPGLPGQPRWKCEVCDHTTLRKQDLRYHRERRHKLIDGLTEANQIVGEQAKKTSPTELLSANLLPCPECGRLFDGPSRLHRHRKIHGEPKWRCEVCDHRTIRKTDLRKHRERRHQLMDELTEENQVEQTLEGAPQTPQAQQHSAIASSSTSESSGSIKYRFDIYLPVNQVNGQAGETSTSRAASTSAFLNSDDSANIETIDLDHEDVEDEVDATLDGSPQASSSNRPWMCEICPSTFTHKYLLRRHLTRSHPESTIPIRLAADWIEAPGKVTLSDGHWKCEVCSSGFKQKRSLVHHRMTIHQLESPVSAETHDSRRTYFQQEAQNQSTNEQQAQQKHQPRINLPNERDPTLLPCPQCGAQFRGQRRLRAHLSSHTAPKWKCEVCDYRVVRKSGLRRHREHRHQLTDEPTKANRVTRQDGNRAASASANSEDSSSNPPWDPLPCPQCGAQFRGRRRLRAHLSSHTEPKWKCELCDYRVVRKSCLRKHREHRHQLTDEPTEANRVTGQDGNRAASASTNSEDSNSNPPLVLLPASSSTNGTTLYPCTQCTGIFRLRSDLEHHMITHAITRAEWACDGCSQLFTRKFDLKRHRQVQHQLTDPVTEERHRIGGPRAPKVAQTHPQLPERVVTCHICSSVYHSERALRTHIGADHLKKAPNGDLSAPAPSAPPRQGRHVCEFCGKNWLTPGSLAIHRRMHTGERPYQCAHCPTRCSNASGLKSHMKRCHPEVVQEVSNQGTRRRWPCATCDEAFSSYYLLMLHLRKKYAQKNEAEAGKTTESGATKRQREEDLKEDPQERPVDQGLAEGPIDQSLLCPKCRVLLPDQAALETHLQIHQRKKPRIVPYAVEEPEIEVVRPHLEDEATTGNSRAPETTGPSPKSTKKKPGPKPKPKVRGRPKASTSLRQLRAGSMRHPRVAKLAQAVKRTVEPAVPTTYRCKPCRRSFKLLGNFKEHLGFYHQGDCPLDCECGMRYATKRELTRHLNANHYVFGKPIAPRKKATVQEIENIEEVVETVVNGEVSMEIEEEEEGTSDEHQESEEQQEVELIENLDQGKLQEDVNLNLELLTDDEDTE